MSKLDVRPPRWLVAGMGAGLLVFFLGLYAWVATGEWWLALLGVTPNIVLGLYGLSRGYDMGGGDG